MLPNGLSEINHIFQSPGPIFEVDAKKDWWQFGRALVPVGIGNGDVIQNCFLITLLLRRDVRNSRSGCWRDCCTGWHWTN